MRGARRAGFDRREGGASRAATASPTTERGDEPRRRRGRATPDHRSSSLPTREQYQRGRAQIAMRISARARRSAITQGSDRPSAADALLLLATSRRRKPRATRGPCATGYAACRVSRRPCGLKRRADLVIDATTGGPSEFDGGSAVAPEPTTRPRALLGRRATWLGDRGGGGAQPRGWRAMMTDEPSSIHVFDAERLGVPLSLPGDAARDRPKVAFSGGRLRGSRSGNLGMEVEQRHAYNRLSARTSRRSFRVATANAFSDAEAARREIGWANQPAAAARSGTGGAPHPAAGKDRVRRQARSRPGARGGAHKQERTSIRAHVTRRRARMMPDHAARLGGHGAGPSGTTGAEMRYDPR